MQPSSSMVHLLHCRWDGCCMEESAWQEGANVEALAQGKAQPFYHVLVHAHDWEDPWEPGITYVPQELLLAPQVRPCILKHAQHLHDRWLGQVELAKWYSPPAMALIACACLCMCLCKCNSLSQRLIQRRHGHASSCFWLKADCIYGITIHQATALNGRYPGTMFDTSSVKAQMNYRQALWSCF